MDNVCNGYGLQHMYFLPCSGTPPGPVTFSASAPFSPSTTTNSTVSPSTLRSYFLGLLFSMVVWCISISFVVSFLLMNPYLFFTLNHVTISKTFTAMTFLSPSAGAANVRPSGLCSCATVVPGLVSAALRVGVAGGCWVLVSRLSCLW